MKLHISQDWINKLLAKDPHCLDDEPTGLLACSPELMAAAEARAGRKWDGTQEDAERLVCGWEPADKT